MRAHGDRFTLQHPGDVAIRELMDKTHADQFSLRIGQTLQMVGQWRVGTRVGGQVKFADEIIIVLLSLVRSGKVAQTTLAQKTIQPGMEAIWSREGMEVLERESEDVTGEFFRFVLRTKGEKMYR